MPGDIDNDPRVFFAAERTLLAWIRTGLTLVATGFLVARFHLIVRVLRPEADVGSHSWATPVGVALTLLGALGSGVSALQHLRFYRTLPRQDLPRDYSPRPGLLLGFGTAIGGFALAVVLVV
jgi:putative membrane protein